jgi:phosphotransferase system enzyme I (PtsI)
MASAKRLELQGLGVSPGLAIGRAVCIETQMLEVFRFPLPESDIGAEIERFRQAVEMAEAEIQTTRLKAHDELGDDLAAIFEAHLLMLGDRAVLGQVEKRGLQNGRRAGRAVREPRESTVPGAQRRPA